MKKLKGIYVANYDLRNKCSGVSQKIKTQLKAFSYYGIEIDYIIAKDAYKTVFQRKILSRLPFTPIISSWRNTPIYKCDFLYIRKPILDLGVILLLKKAKKIGIPIIIMEFPTFPYDKELTNRFEKIPFWVKDKIYRLLLRLYIDYAVTYSLDKKIYGINTICVTNGIDVEEVPMIDKDSQPQSGINLIAVASMQYWHAYERMLYGLNVYYNNGEKSESVYLHFVGNGPELTKYKELVSILDLGKYVFFYGALCGAELDAVFDRCNIAVSGLGFHRSNIFLSSSLKTREYAIKGLPIVSSTKIDIFPKEYDFVLYIPEDESPVNIQCIIDYYQRLMSKYNTRNKLAKSIRTQSETLCDIRNTMKPIIMTLLKNE